MPYNEALKLGATATFGEKYGEFVRVIVFDPSFSIELCGGTHVTSTGKIGLFKITSEGSVSAGVRRIEAVTAGKALEYVDEQIGLLKQIKELVKGQDVLKSIGSLQADNSALQKKVEGMEQQQVIELRNTLLKKIVNEDGLGVLVDVVQVPSSNSLKQLAMELRKESDFTVLGAVIDNKPMIAVAVKDEVIRTHGLHAGNIVKESAKEMGGSGGGQPSYAMGAGSDAGRLRAAVEKAKGFATVKVK